jgi:hypothetical protein
MTAGQDLQFRFMHPRRIPKRALALFVQGGDTCIGMGCGEGEKRKMVDDHTTKKQRPQNVQAGRDAYVAGRDIEINIYYPPAREPRNLPAPTLTPPSFGPTAAERYQRAHMDPERSTIAFGTREKAHVPPGASADDDALQAAWRAWDAVK